MQITSKDVMIQELDRIVTILDCSNSLSEGLQAYRRKVSITVTWISK